MNENNKAGNVGETFKHMPIRKNSVKFFWLSTAVSLILLIFLGVLGYSYNSYIKTQKAVRDSLLATIESQREELSEQLVMQNTEDVSSEDIEELEAIIAEQSKLLEEQQRKIDELQAQQEGIENDSGATTGNDPDYVSYTVQAGDSIYEICEDMGIDFSENIGLIKEINGLSDPNLIDVGQILKFPAA